MADAINKKAELVVTIGAVQSNHARQIINTSKRTLLGIKCLVILEHRLKKSSGKILEFRKCVFG